VNRHDRRARAAQARGEPTDAEVERIVAGARWKQRVDPDDPGYALIEFRIPIPDAAAYPETEYEGRAAYDRLNRFLHAYVAGVSDGHERRGMS
jgi:hypothetical protein